MWVGVVVEFVIIIQDFDLLIWPFFLPPLSCAWDHIFLCCLSAYPLRSLRMSTQPASLPCIPFWEPSMAPPSRSPSKCHVIPDNERRLSFGSSSASRLFTTTATPHNSRGIDFPFFLAPNDPIRKPLNLKFPALCHQIVTGDEQQRGVCRPLTQNGWMAAGVSLGNQIKVTLALSHSSDVPRPHSLEDKNVSFA